MILYPIGLEHYLAVSAIIFTIGLLIVLIRKNILVVLMGIELMLNATSISILSFSHFSAHANGQILVFFVMVIAAAEAVVGLALAVAVFKKMKKNRYFAF